MPCPSDVTIDGLDSPWPSLCPPSSSSCPDLELGGLGGCARFSTPTPFPLLTFYAAPDPRIFAEDPQNVSNGPWVSAFMLQSGLGKSWAAPVRAVRPEVAWGCFGELRGGIQELGAWSSRTWTKWMLFRSGDRGRDGLLLFSRMIQMHRGSNSTRLLCP